MFLSMLAPIKNTLLNRRKPGFNPVVTMPYINIYLLFNSLKSAYSGSPTLSVAFRNHLIQGLPHC